MTIPSVLKPLVSKFQDTVTRTKLTVSPNVIGPYPDNASITFRLPTGIIIDLSTLCINFNIHSLTAGAQMPRFAESFIRSVDIKTTGGQTISTLTDYNEIATIVKAWNAGGIEHELDPFTTYHKDTEADTTYVLSVRNLLFGILNEQKSRLFSLEAIGLEITINFAPLKVVAQKGANDTDLKITKADLVVDSVYFAQDSYSELLRSALTSDGLKMTFPTYSLSTSQVFTNAIDAQMNLTSGSLDGVLSIVKKATYFSEDQPKTVDEDGNNFQMTCLMPPSAKCSISVNGHRMASLDCDSQVAFSTTQELAKHLGYSGHCRRWGNYSAVAAVVGAVRSTEMGMSGLSSYSQPSSITCRYINHDGDSKIMKLIAFRTVMVTLDAANNLTVME